jgi:hypothetical protein
MVLATSLSVGMAFTLEYTNPSFRTPSELFSELNIPVLAAVPQRLTTFPANGNGNKNGNGHNGNGNGVHQPTFVNDDSAVDGERSGK